MTPDRLRMLALLGVSLCAFTACTVSLSGGALGALTSVGIVFALLLLTGATQTGCVEDPPTRDDAEVDDIDVGPCLRDSFPLMPCLRIAPDLGPDTTVMPCLGPLEPDAGRDAAPDLAIGPCLEPEPDAAPIPMGNTDGGVDAAPDAHVGPCLDTPPEPEPPDGKAMRAIDASAIFAKVAAGLPSDVAARLVRPPEDV